MKLATDGYTSTAKWLHWGMALVWVFSWVLGFLASHWREELKFQPGLTFVHKALAATLIFLIVVRVAWRLTHRPPALPETMNSLMRRAAALGHFALYAVALIALPVSGWFWSSVAGKPIMVLGLFPLVPITDANPDLYTLAQDIHTWTSWFCGALVGGHTLVALKHHFINKDNIVAGMLPKTRYKNKNPPV